MHVEYGFLADSATKQPNGKVNAQGIGLRRFTVSVLPGRTQACAVICCIVVEPHEAGKDHPVLFQVWHEQTGPVDITPHNASFHAKPNSIDSNRQTVLLFVKELKFASIGQTGVHEIRVTVPGASPYVIPVWVDLDRA